MELGNTAENLKKTALKLPRQTALQCWLYEAAYLVSITIEADTNLLAASGSSSSSLSSKGETYRRGISMAQHYESLFAAQETRQDDEINAYRDFFRQVRILQTELAKFA